VERDPDNPTRMRLIDVATSHFGRLGLEGASTRAIAAEADTPMSSITYHFGGKAGLYVAVAEQIAAGVAARLAPILSHVESIRGRSGGGSAQPVLARAALHLLIDRLIELMTREDSAIYARFIVREQAEPTAAAPTLRDGALGPAIEAMAAMLGCVALGHIDDEDARLRAIALLGQVLAFRLFPAAPDDAEGERAAKQAIGFIVDAVLDHMERVAARGR